MIIRDSLNVKANFKNAKFDWTELQCLKFHYFLQEVSDTTNLGGPINIIHMDFLDPWDMQDLLQSNQHLGLT